MHPKLRSLLTVTVAIVALGACSMWKPQPLSPSAQLRGDARVLRADNRVVALRTPAITADSISGNTAIGQRVSIPLSTVRAVYTRRPDAIRSVALRGALGLAAVLVRNAFHEDVVY